MREIDVSGIRDAVHEMCIEANCKVGQDIYEAFGQALDKEESSVGSYILGILKENADVAAAEQMPICQDTGVTVVFVKIGQDVHVIGGSLEEAVNQGVRSGYEAGYLRKSVVDDPLKRVNTGDNTPAVIHYEIVPGDVFELTISPKGFGSENMSRIHMLKPADGIEGVKECIVRTVYEAGANPCPPVIVGVGLGGTFEKAAILAKRALLRPVGQYSDIPHIRELEKDLLERINALGIGPQGLGGTTTALGVHIETYPTHIAGLPVAVNIGCHVTRHVNRRL